MLEKNFYTYLLRCADGTLYTGWTTDVAARMKVHNQGKGAKYTRGRLPVNLVGSWRFETKSEAMKFEAWLKTLPKDAKARLAQMPDAVSGLLLRPGLPRPLAD